MTKYTGEFIFNKRSLTANSEGIGTDRSCTVQNSRSLHAQSNVLSIAYYAIEISMPMAQVCNFPATHFEAQVSEFNISININH